MISGDDSIHGILPQFQTDPRAAVTYIFSAAFQLFATFNFQIPCFPFSYHSFQTDPQADIFENHVDNFRNS